MLVLYLNFHLLDRTPRKREFSQRIKHSGQKHDVNEDRFLNFEPRRTFRVSASRSARVTCPIIPKRTHCVTRHFHFKHALMILVNCIRYIIPLTKEQS